MYFEPYVDTIEPLLLFKKVLTSFVTEACNFMYNNFVQSLNAAEPILTTEVGTLTIVILEQFMNASIPILVIEFGIFIAVNEPQFLNARFPIVLI